MESNDKELLELFIITYNRSLYLDNTLRQLIGCPFSIFSITVVDNCSSDNTHEIYLKYKEKFSKLNYIKNKINIGADANVLRAAELSNGVYTWILCDDDYYDFTFCDDILVELAKKKVAAAMIGWAEHFVWPVGGMYDSATNLMKKGFPYLSVPTFVPGSIFKTDLFQNQIGISYTNIVNFLPVMTYYINLYKTDEYFYVSKRKIVIAAALAPYDYSFFRVVSAVINTFYLLDLPDVRRQAFYACYLTQPSATIYRHALMWKRTKNELSLLTKWRYFRLLYWKGKLVFLVSNTVGPAINRLLYLYRYVTSKPQH